MKINISKLTFLVFICLVYPLNIVCFFLSLFGIHSGNWITSAVACHSNWFCAFRSCHSTIPPALHFVCGLLLSCLGPNWERILKYINQYDRRYLSIEWLIHCSVILNAIFWNAGESKTMLQQGRNGFFVQAHLSFDSKMLCLFLWLN